MNRTISFKTTVALASVSAFALFSPVVAQEEATEEKPAAEAVDATAAEQVFTPLMRCTHAEGSVLLLRPRTQGWVAAEEGHYYPLGSVVRVAGQDGVAPLAEFAFGEKSTVLVTNDAEFVTREVEFGAQERTVVLKAGRINLNLPRSLRDGLFKVVAPAFTCENLAGESRFDYSSDRDGDEVVVRCVTGTMTLKGSHYEIPKMGAANQLRIRTTGDRLFSSLRGESGDCKMKLSMGLMPERNFETGELKDAPRDLDFSLSPQCVVKIFRARSAVTGRMSVSTMTFSPSGEMLNRFVFAEGSSALNSGELIISTKIPEEASAKKADDDEAETVEVKAGDDEEKDDKKDE